MEDNQFLKKTSNTNNSSHTKSTWNIWHTRNTKNTRNTLNTGVQEVHGITWNMNNGIIKGMHGTLGKQDKQQSTGTQGIYESIATVGEIRIWWRADFQSGSRVLKKVF